MKAPEPVTDEALKKFMASTQKQVTHLEETNRQLLLRQSKLKELSKTLTVENRRLHDEVNKLNGLLQSHELGNSVLQQQISRDRSEYEENLERLNEQMKAQKEEYEGSKRVLEQMFEALQRTVETEQRLRHQVESELAMDRKKLINEMEQVKRLQKRLSAATQDGEAIEFNQPNVSNKP